MKVAPQPSIYCPCRATRRQEAQVRVALLILTSFLLGVVIGVLGYRRLTLHAPAPVNSSTPREAQREKTNDSGTQPQRRATIPTPSAATASDLAASADPEALQEVQRIIPHSDTVTLEKGKQMLQVAALAQFKQAAQAMEKQIQAAEQHISQLKQQGSATGQKAAVQHLQQLQAEQTEKLQAIAARLQAQLAAWSHLKNTAPAGTQRTP